MLLRQGSDPSITSTCHPYADPLTVVVQYWRQAESTLWILNYAWKV